MSLSAAQVQDIYNIFEDALVTIMKAETTITDLLDNNVIETQLRNNVRDYMDSDLPAIAVQASAGDDADNEAEGAVREILKVIPVNVWCIGRGAKRGDTSRRVQKLTATVEAFLRKQIDSGSELAVAIDQSSGIHVKNLSTQFGDAESESQSMFEVIGNISLTVLVDICVDLP